MSNQTHKSTLSTTPPSSILHHQQISLIIEFPPNSNPQILLHIPTSEPAQRPRTAAICTRRSEYVFLFRRALGPRTLSLLVQTATMTAQAEAEMSPARLGSRIAAAVTVTAMAMAMAVGAAPLSVELCHDSLLGRPLPSCHDGGTTWWYSS